MHETVNKALKILASIAVLLLLYVTAFIIYYVDTQYGKNVIEDAGGYMIAFILFYIPISLIVVKRTLREIIGIIIALAAFLSIAYVQKTFFPAFPEPIFRTFALLYMLVFAIVMNRWDYRCPYHIMFIMLAIVASILLGYEVFEFFSLRG